MGAQLTPAMLVNIPILLLAATLAGYGGIRYLLEGRRQELLAFITLMVGIALWQLANILRDLFTAPSLKLRMLHAFLVLVVPLFTYSLLWFALAYSDASGRRIRAVGGLFLAEVLMIGAGLALDPELLQTVAGTVYNGPATVLNLTFDRWAVLDRTFRTTASVRQLYHYTVWVLSGAILVRYTLRHRPGVAVGQVVALAGGVGTTVVVSSLLFLGVLPPELALTDVALGVLAIGLAVAVFRYRLLDLTAVGRQQFVEGMDDPLVFLDDGNGVVYSNPAARQLFDVGANWRKMDATDFFAPHADQLRRAGTGGPTDGGPVELAGPDRYFDLNSTTIRTPAGDTGGEVLALREVTELEQTNRRLDQFASMVSHDLRTPLNDAMVQADRLAGARSDERTETLREELDRMESILDDMLDLARAGSSVETTETCPLEELVEEVWAALRTEGAELDCRVTDTTIQADTVRLFQALENLLRNALDHNDTPLTVRVGTLDGGEGVPPADDPAGFFVEDDGRGIPGDEHDDVFDHGYTTSRNGNGYGLSVVRHIVAAHGWEIRVTDGSDGGARFEITGVESG